jgi:hypothetical protein
MPTSRDRPGSMGSSVSGTRGIAVEGRNKQKKKKKTKMRTAPIDWKALGDDPDAFVEASKHMKRHSPKAKRIRGGAF